MFRIATWNVNSLRVRLPHILQWIESEQPDVLALQETKMTDENFPVEELRNAGYHVIFSGQKTYNGVATLSKAEAANVITDFPDFDDPQRRILCTTINNVTILNLYIPNGSEVDSDKYRYKLEWLAHLRKFTESLVNKYENVVLLGDFNIAPEDRDVHDPIAWKGKVLVSPPERDAFHSLLKNSLVDCFRIFEQEDNSFSWWDYRAAGFQRNLGLRIDHILATDTLADLCTACRIDKYPRTLERPSDHTPVVAEFDI
ncbi:MAG: exodeoxyribonuclease III [Gammaproteobacteria bacterium]|nr:exodeoxyribonuclease III [Gammaproteobacteria bacterium]MCK5669234.1 exodeoxyribonuclease III [Gammaproteobacteria bacterium]